jgi:hypothetical protein
MQVETGAANTIAGKSCRGAIGVGKLQGSMLEREGQQAICPEPLASITEPPDLLWGGKRSDEHQKIISQGLVFRTVGHGRRFTP